MQTINTSKDTNQNNDGTIDKQQDLTNVISIKQTQLSPRGSANSSASSFAHFVHQASKSQRRLHLAILALIVIIVLLFLFLFKLVRVQNTEFLQNNDVCKMFIANQSAPAVSGKCPDQWFMCKSCSGICIERSKVCNDIADCPDGSDEQECYDANKELLIMYAEIIKNLKEKGPVKGVNDRLAKPLDCTTKQLLENKCPCNLKDPLVIFCNDKQVVTIPQYFEPSVIKIIIDNASIEHVDYVQWPSSLGVLMLQHNIIKRIENDTFLSAPNLKKILLGSNQIYKIDNDAFKRLKKLKVLQLHQNNLTTFDSSVLRYSPNIQELYLEENSIDLPLATNFSKYKMLREVRLQHNEITVIRKHWFCNMPKLFSLWLDNNKIEFIEDAAFQNNNNLNQLKMSFNRLKVITMNTFSTKPLRGLQGLSLKGNFDLQWPETNFINNMPNLSSLNFEQIIFTNPKLETFELANFSFIYFEKFSYCHFAPKVRVCRPSTNGLSTNDDLLAFPLLKHAVWIVALVCTFGNIFVFIWRTLSPKEDEILSILIRNLSIADLLMAVYLFAIGWKNNNFTSTKNTNQPFRQGALEWISSNTCVSLGFVGILSCELSVFILTIITIERYKSIVSTNKIDVKQKKRQAKRYLILAWLASFVIASFPLVQQKINTLFHQHSHNYHYHHTNNSLSNINTNTQQLFATNALCLPLHVEDPFASGWQYSAFVFLGINFTAALLISGLYFHMYTIIVGVRNLSRPHCSSHLLQPNSHPLLASYHQQQQQQTPQTHTNDVFNLQQNNYSLISSNPNIAISKPNNSLTPQNAAPNNHRANEDAVLALRFLFIVITDCLCWIPVVVVKILALSRVNIDGAVLGWLVVLVIPINSALNPIIYTLAAPTKLRCKIVAMFEFICDCVEKVWHKLQQQNLSSLLAISNMKLYKLKFGFELKANQNKESSTSPFAPPAYDEACFISSSSPTPPSAPSFHTNNIL